MELFYGGLEPWMFWTACAITLGAGFVKGAIGFAMPLIMMSGFGSFMPPVTALAGLVIATVATNIHQTFRWGWRPAAQIAWSYRRMIGTTIVGILVTAPLAVQLPQSVLLGMLGALILAFALFQLSGGKVSLPAHLHRPAEWLTGVVGGLYGGVSGIWGPPVVIYLLATGASKVDSIRTQGVIFLIGAVVLLGAHLNTGVLNATTLPFSVALLVPAAIGMAVGFRLQDRLDPVAFRRWTLVLLVVTALNLLRKAFVG